MLEGKVNEVHGEGRPIALFVDGGTVFALGPDRLILPPKVSVSQAMNSSLAKLREAFGA